MNVRGDRAARLFEWAARISSLSEVPGRRLRYHTMRDFEVLYDSMPGPNYGWFQCRFHVEARRLVDTSGAGVVRRLWDAFRIEDRETAEKLRSEVDPQLDSILETLD
jgi:hypothetical protein